MGTFLHGATQPRGSCESKEDCLRNGVQGVATSSRVVVRIRWFEMTSRGAMSLNTKYWESAIVSPKLRRLHEENVQDCEK